jgi:hypothetical protein
MFELPSRLVTIKHATFSSCESLNRLCIPASVRAIHDLVFMASGLGSIGLEEGSISFRVLNDLSVDFDVRALLYVIDSAESIFIPSPIEELRQFCRCYKMGLSNLEFESDSHLRSIGESAFRSCESLESICIPSSVGVLQNCCFSACSNLRTVTFDRESNLRSIGECAFRCCGSLESICIPSSVEFLRKGCFESCPNLRTVTFDPDSKLRVIEGNAVGRSVELVSVPASAEVIGR